MTLPRITFLLASCIAVAGCTMPYRVVKLYQSSVFVGGPCANVLVVGVHENADLRRQFETSVTRYLGNASTAAAASIDVMGAISGALVRDGFVR